MPTPNPFDAINDRLDTIERRLNATVIDSIAITRLIAILNPIFAMPEDDPRRKEASEKLGEAVMKRMRGEYLAMNPDAELPPTRTKPTIKQIGPR